MSDNSIVRDRARVLRHQQTPVEAMLWARLRGQQLEGFKFRRQQPFGSYIVDFFCPSSRLIVEIDGDSHAEQVEYDAARTAWLEQQGCRVVRFTNREVQYNLDSVVEAIVKACREG